MTSEETAKASGIAQRIRRHPALSYRLAGGAGAVVGGEARGRAVSAPSMALSRTACRLAARQGVAPPSQRRNEKKEFRSSSFA
jgi:hypothetical protein